VEPRILRLRSEVNLNLQFTFHSNIGEFPCHVLVLVKLNDMPQR
jgi:hypothetical protein